MKQEDHADLWSRPPSWRLALVFVLVVVSAIALLYAINYLQARG